MNEYDKFEDDLGPIEEGGGRSPPPSSDKDANQWAMWIHLSNLITYVSWPISIAAPIILWQIKKDEMPSVDVHGKNAVNWAISFAIYLVVSTLLTMILIGIVLLIPLLVAGVVFPIIAGLKANEGVVWRYPLTIEFLK